MRTLILILVVFLSGCAGIGPVVEAVASLEDQSRVQAELILCRGISIGAWIRAYGDNPEKAAAWRLLCQDTWKAMPK